jgi:hypothetical protein
LSESQAQEITAVAQGKEKTFKTSHGCVEGTEKARRK